MEACHDKIKTMMKPYWQKFGRRIRFDQILDAANMNVWDLPQLDRHLDGNGKNRLCWPNLLGCCTRHNCSFMHESGRDLPEAFVEDACLKLESGVTSVVNNESELRVGPWRTVDRAGRGPGGGRGQGGGRGNQGRGGGRGGDRDVRQRLR